MQKLNDNRKVTQKLRKGAPVDLIDVRVRSRKINGEKELVPGRPFSQRSENTCFCTVRQGGKVPFLALKTADIHLVAVFNVNKTAQSKF